MFCIWWFSSAEDNSILQNKNKTKQLKTFSLCDVVFQSPWFKTQEMAQYCPPCQQENGWQVLHSKVQLECLQQQGQPSKWSMDGLRLCSLSFIKRHQARGNLRNWFLFSSYHFSAKCRVIVRAVFQHVLLAFVAWKIWMIINNCDETSACWGPVDRDLFIHVWIAPWTHCCFVWRGMDLISHFRSSDFPNSKDGGLISFFPYALRSFPPLWWSMEPAELDLWCCSPF